MIAWLHLSSTSVLSASSLENLTPSGEMSENSADSWWSAPIAKSKTFDSFSWAPKVPCEPVNQFYKVQVYQKLKHVPADKDHPEIEF